MKAGWIGQIAGVSWGAPTEFKLRGPDHPRGRDAQVDSPAMINDAFGQDDLYVEMTFLRSLEQYGLDVSIRQAGIDFANSGYPLWCANNAGRDEPPQRHRPARLQPSASSTTAPTTSTTRSRPTSRA